jgi:hypothetical protein
MLPDLSDYKKVGDILPLFFGILTLDTLVLFLARAGFFGKALNKWYDRFGLLAVLSDCLIILIGFLIARYLYTIFLKPSHGWNPLLFIGLVVVLQVIHDILFFLGIIRPIPRGWNGMMDVFKDYSIELGGKIIGGDALLMIGSWAFASLYKAIPQHAFIGAAALTGYLLPYAITTVEY